MTSEKDIVASAAADAPELLDLETLDSITGGIEYGGTNTCEPPRGGGGKWIDILSWSWGTASSFEQVTGVLDLKSK